MTTRQFERILIVRTDRIGDVLLSTPVIKAVRENYPDGYIAMMIRPYARDIVNGNPYLDELLIYDKDGIHKSWFSSLKFGLNLKKKSFDLAIVLHPTNRVHIITFLARIPKRIGYDKKFGFLLTQKLPDEKRFGKKHESEYALDMIRTLGMEVKDKSLFMPIKKESEEYIERLLQDSGVTGQDILVAIHPGASCPSKRWPPERFAQVVDKLIQDYKLKVVIISSPEQVSIAQKVIQSMSNRPVDLCGKTTLSQLASLLKRCALFISNDSGPVHIASSVGTPVVDIFGRNEAGLSPIRWGPLGKNDAVLHKEVGCIECLAHNCQKNFACLKAIRMDEVYQVTYNILCKFSLKRQ
jgi:heptosyltransferase-2